MCLGQLAPLGGAVDQGRAETPEGEQGDFLEREGLSQV